MATWERLGDVEVSQRTSGLQRFNENGFRVEAGHDDEGFVSSTDVPAPSTKSLDSTNTVFEQYEGLKSEGNISVDMHIGILSALGSSIAGDLHNLFALNDKSERIGEVGTRAAPNYVYANLGTPLERDVLKKEVFPALDSLTETSKLNDSARHRHDLKDRTFLSLNQNNGRPQHSYESSYADGAILVACTAGDRAAKFRVSADSLPDDLLGKIDKVNMFNGSQGENNAKVLLCCGLLEGISQAISEEYNATAKGEPLKVERIENLGAMLEKVTQKSLQVCGEYNAVRQNHKDAETIRNQLVADFKKCEEYRVNKLLEAQTGRENGLKILADKCREEGLSKARMGELLVENYPDLDSRKRDFCRYIINTDPEIGICDPKIVGEEIKLGNFVNSIGIEVANIKTVAAAVLKQLGKFTSEIKELVQGKKTGMDGQASDKTWQDRTGNSVDSQQDTNPANSKW